MSVQFLQGDTVRLRIPDDAALDGAEAVLVDREARKKRWRVRLTGGREVLVKHAHLVHPTTPTARPSASRRPTTSAPTCTGTVSPANVCTAGRG